MVNVELRLKALELAVRWHGSSVPPSNNYKSDMLIDIAKEFMLFLYPEKEIEKVAENSADKKPVAPPSSTKKY